MVHRPSRVKQILLEHFSTFLKAGAEDTLVNIGNLEVNKLTNEDRDQLERPFTLEEATLALQESKSNKSPGPDGVNAACLKHCWKQLHHSFTKLLDGFYHSGNLSSSINSSFIALISKVANPILPEDFRPIRLINNIMKILLKMLANRLKTKLPRTRKFK